MNKISPPKRTDRNHSSTKSARSKVSDVIEEIASPVAKQQVGNSAVAGKAIAVAEIL